MRPGLLNMICSSHSGWLMPNLPPRTHHPPTPDSLWWPFYTPELWKLLPSLLWPPTAPTVCPPLELADATSFCMASSNSSRSVLSLSTASLPRRITVQVLLGAGETPRSAGDSKGHVRTRQVFQVWNEQGSSGFPGRGQSIWITDGPVQGLVFPKDGFWAL